MKLVMKKTLTVVVAILALSAVSARAAIMVTEMQNIPFSTELDPSAPYVAGQTPALWVTGTWSELSRSAPGWSADNWGDPSAAWSWLVGGTVLDIGGGAALYVVSVEAVHNIDPPVQSWQAAIGLYDVAGVSGQIIGTILHGLEGLGDHYLFTASINPAGTMNFDLKACHVPEPELFAMFAGVGLVGFAAYRRIRR